jgi:hypothetical protein
MSENIQREIGLVLQPDDTYVFDENAASGSGPVIIDIVEDDYSYTIVSGLSLDVAEPGSAAVDFDGAGKAMDAEFVGVPRAGDLATLRLSGVAPGNVSVRVVDVAGRIHEDRTAHCSGNCEVLVKMPEPRGVYFIRVQASAGVTCTKRVVLVQ